MLTSIELALVIQTLLSLALVLSLERRYRQTFKKLQEHAGALSSFQSSYFHVSRVAVCAAGFLTLALAITFFSLRVSIQESYRHWSWAAAWGAICITGFVLLICGLFDIRVRIIPKVPRGITIVIACVNILSAPLAVFAPVSWWHRIL